MTDKTQEELIRSITDYVFQHDFSKAGSEYVDLRLFLEKVITHYINKYYVPKGDLESPSVANEVGGNQVDSLSDVYVKTTLSKSDGKIEQL